MSTNTSNVNYIAEFYKAKEHNYSSFFSGYTDDTEYKICNKELKNLLNQVEEKKAELSRLYAKRYNEQFTPLSKDCILHYLSAKTNNEAYFNIITSKAIDKEHLTNESNFRFIDVSRKTGSFETLVGYCLPLGAIVSREYSFKISSDNSQCSFVLQNEYLVPVVDYSAPIIDKKGNKIPKTSKDTRFSVTEFVQKMYNLPDFDCSLSVATLLKALKNNASTEVILRTSPNKEITQSLLKMDINKAEPIYKILGVTKQEYDILNEKGFLNEYFQIKEIIKNSLNPEYKKNKVNLKEEDFFHYTTLDWIDIIEKARYWDTELQFNKVTTNDGILLDSLKYYLRYDYYFSTATFYKHYSFGKFMDYVAEESCNQGFQRLSAFVTELKDYLSMCETMKVTPSLYTSYLKQTHDILARNYNIKITEEQEKLFANRYKDFKKFTTKDGEYSVVCPKNSEDVKKEGYSLNHCISSYISKILNGSSFIVFLRKANKTSDSLVSVEIVNHAIIQARGASNRSINKKEFAALKEYAIANNLKVAVTPRD